MNYHEHVQATEECLANAIRQAGEFEALCQSITVGQMGDRETLLMVQLKLSVVQVSLAESQAHAALALAVK